MNNSSILSPDSSLYESIYRTYHPKVYGYIYSKLRNAENAEDITADVFVKVYEKLPGFDAKKASLSTWIYTVARNTLIDFYRTHKVTAEIPETLDDGTSLEDEVCSSEMLETLADALETLEGRERDIILLRFYSGKTLREIAAGMGISYAYVKVLQNKALGKLKKFMGE